jgi:hypothetical protein
MPAMLLIVPKRQRGKKAYDAPRPVRRAHAERRYDQACSCPLQRPGHAPGQQRPGE